jgi:(R)-2-hydroxyacyl-CoA dehydratese activating ATPase
MITLGIDVGSTCSKCVILEDGRKILATDTQLIGTGTKGPYKAFEEALRKANLKREDIDFVMATGYGRNTFESADDQMSEISCHAKGVFHMYPDCRTIIDIGGQDAKAIRLTDKGRVLKFLMNDKCAAGTGRFLNVMSGVLDVPIADFNRMDLESTKSVSISSTCTVFAESEVISLLAKGIAIPDIIKSIHKSIAVRVGGLTNRLGCLDGIVMTGGVALDLGVVRALEENIQHKIAVSEISQLNGAFGAAILGYERLLEKENESVA